MFAFLLILIGLVVVIFSHANLEDERLRNGVIVGGGISFLGILILLF